MNIYQPMLFVGLGGTGCAIGASLERRLREELCGPNGTKLRDDLANQEYLPFQLPACVQFVYADLNDAELRRLEGAVVPSDAHALAARRTMHLVTDLVPQLDTYPEVARSLRTSIPQYVEGWLPPPRHEPLVAPLHRGAGQLPTAARAALFETVRNSPGSVEGPISRALDRISQSGGELQRLGGRQTDSVDVYVAFSMAGGTGSGIFYDFLHLLGHVIKGSRHTARIFPLVIMPSAFPEGLGGGRRAILNSGRGLLDLFRLVDDQNGQGAQTDPDAAPADGVLSIRYPELGDVRLRASTIQTAFLFSRTPGMDREDLHRSAVSLILSLIGTDGQVQQERARVSDTLAQSFADSFINLGVEREVPAPTGIGSRGVSTGLVASMTVPRDDLADIVSSRIVANAVNTLMSPPPGGGESNDKLVERFFEAAHISQVLRRAPRVVNPPPEPPKGAEAVFVALQERLKYMDANLRSLDQQLSAGSHEMARAFDPARAVEELLGEVDPFRLSRVVNGHPLLQSVLSQQGVSGMLDRLSAEPPPPPGVTMAPPQPRRPQAGPFRRASWSDPAVQAQLELQDRWYEWRTRVIWHSHWGIKRQVWSDPLNRVKRQLEEQTGAFLRHARDEPERFERRVGDLYKPRTAVSYLLPPHGKDLAVFYENVRVLFVTSPRYREQLRNTADEAEIVYAVTRIDKGWRDAYVKGKSADAERSVQELLTLVKTEVKDLIQDEHAEHPLLPPLSGLLARAARKDGPKVSDADLVQFQQKLAALLPGGFSPEGNGRLKILISYPAPAPNPDLERFLKEKLHLPKGQGLEPEFTATNTESIAVVLFRTSMSVTEVPEVRQVLKHWADATEREEPQDFLRWRQRLGYDYGYLTSTPDDRVRVLHHLLCALWNGQVSVVEGPANSPSKIRIRLPADNATTMTLPLSRYERASSWGNILRAYELWTVRDDQPTRRQFCEELMKSTPIGATSEPKAPDELYHQFVGMAREEIKLLTEMIPKLPESGRGWADHLLQLWRDTLPAALRTPFPSLHQAIRPDLLTLEEWRR
ncbi:hypothetical protein Aph01nite_14120 [Acrocarpospora phusangensis]|uniref:Tubulin-like doman-containing protein n=1 Tax=Acrocarpospora phusangensis TaxID=1070424 RepID=A0A919UMA1_9ACTN|nr:tubulin-like doman-containing protein [Acrocarpospora phusangensis]GIH23102.1 hypothetical protein Aph01nite_14120 [Acrocarpospora phusangensis]